MDAVTVAIIAGVVGFWCGFFWRAFLYPSGDRRTATSGNSPRPEVTRPIDLSTLQKPKLPRGGVAPDGEGFLH